MRMLRAPGRGPSAAADTACLSVRRMPTMSRSSSMSEWSCCSYSWTRGQSSAATRRSSSSADGCPRPPYTSVRILILGEKAIVHDGRLTHVHILKDRAWQYTQPPLPRFRPLRTSPEPTPLSMPRSVPGARARDPEPCHSLLQRGARRSRRASIRCWRSPTTPWRSS